MWHGSDGGRLERLSVWTGGHGSDVYFTVVPHRWTDCHEVNPALVCPSPPSISMNSVMMGP